MKQTIDLDKIMLKVGAHEDLNDGACVMELVSFMAGEKWSDNPECSCPVLAAFARRINDRMNDEYRQKLKPLIPKLLNSVDNQKRKVRREFFAHQAITIFLPLLTDALELTEISTKLREFKIGDWIAARVYIYSVKPEIRAKAAYAYAYADAADAAAACVAAACVAAADAADADAAAYAYADAADAADAAADAAAACVADAAACVADAAAYAYADAAAAADADPKTKFWLEVRNKIWQAGIDALDKACDL